MKLLVIFAYISLQTVQRSSVVDAVKSLGLVHNKTHVVSLKNLYKIYEAHFLCMNDHTCFISQQKHNDCTIRHESKLKLLSLLCML